MSNQAEAERTKSDGHVSSMYGFVARLPPPALILGPLPSMRAAVALNSLQSSSSINAPRPLEWLKFVQARPKQAATKYASLLRPPPTVCFFGEQHNQVNVLRAQLQLLCELHDVAQQMSRPLHVVVEYFSMPEQIFIDAFDAGALTLEGMDRLNRLIGGEGFPVRHMAPLLMLAKELKNVKVHAGFPPRAWAKEIRSRERQHVMPDIRAWHQEYNLRADDKDYDPTSNFKSAASKEDPCKIWRSDAWIGDRIWLPRLPALLPAMAEQQIYSITAAHRAYLSSLFKPDVPPAVPTQVSADEAKAAAEQAGPRAYAAWQNAAASHIDGFAPHLVALGKAETSGFAPAQAFKDLYFAHVIDSILSDAAASGQAEPIVLAIAGSGHIEYGLGAPARLRAMRAERRVKEEEKHVVIVSKPSDSGVWVADAGRQEESARRGWEELDDWERPIADGVVIYEWIEE